MAVTQAIQRIVVRHGRTRRIIERAIGPPVRQASRSVVSMLRWSHNTGASLGNVCLQRLRCM